MAAPKAIAYFVSEHGFGHAARSSAVLAELGRIAPTTRLTVVSTVPKWFFDDSLEIEFDYIPLQTDVGLIQETSLREDLTATVEALDRFFPIVPHTVDRIASLLLEGRYDRVVCDISPLGLLAAERAGIRSILIENFTWDWIYRGFLDECPDLETFASYLSAIYDRVSTRIQVEPFCKSVDGSLQVPPLSRRSIGKRETIRNRLGVPSDYTMALVTMGGLSWDYSRLDRRPTENKLFVVVPGGATEQRIDTKRALLPFRSGWHHPDLIGAADVVVGKLGYSTLAEVYHAGVPFLYVPRPRFRESSVLERFTRRELRCSRLSESEFSTMNWADNALDLATGGRTEIDRPNSAGQIAREILQHA